MQNSFFAKTAIYLAGKRLNKSFEKAVINPCLIQQKLLLKILNKNKHTEFGKLYDFSGIHNETEFRNKIPIHNYENLSPFVEKIINGDKNVLISDNPLMFNITSGTSGTPKYIPITRESQKLTVQLMTQWLYQALTDHPKLLNGGILGISGSAIEGFAPSGIPLGCASGMIYKNLPWLLSQSYAIPYIVSEIEDYELKYYLMMRLAIASSISFVITPNPSTLIRLAEIGIKYQEMIINSIREGRLLNAQSDFSPNEKDWGIMKEIESKIKPDLERADFLNKLLNKYDRLIPSKYWPKIEMIGCWLGGSAGFQAKFLDEFYGENVAKRDLGLLASEGSFSIPHKDNSLSGILAIQNNFYEFIPEEKIDEKKPPTLLSHELEVGKRYFTILTTTSGLYRYNINDIIEVTGFYKKTPKLSFVSKGQDMTNITGEKMHVNHLMLAMNKIKSQYNLDIRQFRAVSNLPKNRYDIFLKINSSVSDAFLSDILIPKLDEALSDVNIEYKQKRQSGRIKDLCLHIMDDKWEDEIFQKSIESGQRDTQYKWRQLSCSPYPLDAKHIKKSIEL